MVYSPRQKKVLFFLVLIGFLIALHYFGLNNYLSLDQFKQNRNFFLEAVDSHYGISVLAYCFLYACAVACAFPSSSVLTLIGGYLFGGGLGTVYSTVAATVGASVLFLNIRYFFGSNFQKKYAQQLQNFNRSVRQDGITYLLLVRFVVIIPFFLVNICAGLSKVSFFDFVVTTALGIIPATAVYSCAGKELQAINSFKDIFSVNLLFIFLLLGLLAMVPLVRKRHTKILDYSSRGKP